MNKGERRKEKEVESRPRRAAGSPLSRPSSRLGLIAKRSTLNAKVNPRSGFTLLELIIVLAILTILIGAVVFVLDPLEMVDRARDNQRMTDLEAISGAIRLAKSDAPIIEEAGYDPDAANTNTCAGELSQTVYVSVPLSETPPANLPTGWSYGQVTAANLQKIDGNGWLPIDLTAGSSAPPIPALPIDPENTFSSGYYYEYVCTRGGGFELNARLVSERYRTGGVEDKQSFDAGDDDFVYENGSEFELNPKRPVGYWTFDEGSGTSSSDKTVFGNDATFYNAPPWITECPRGTCLDFNGTSQYVIASGGAEMIANGSDRVTFLAWAKKDTSGGGTFAHKNGPFFLRLVSVPGTPTYSIYIGSWLGAQGTTSLVQDKWYHIGMVYNNTGAGLANFIDGVSDGTAPAGGAIGSSINCISIGWSTSGGCSGASPTYFNGKVDEFAIYDRALDVAEFRYQYEALKP